MRVAEHGHAVGRERQHLVDRRLKCLGGLVRQAVNQIHAQAFKSQFARRQDQVARHFVRLHAVNRLLHLRLEILNAHAEPVESETPQRFQMRAAGHARIDFDSDLGVRRERKPLARVPE